MGKGGRSQVGLVSNDARGPVRQPSSRRTGSKKSPPSPFHYPSEALAPFLSKLSKKHVYLTTVDSKPASFKRQIFLVPVAMNAFIALLFVWRMYMILPWYWKLVGSAFGYVNETSFDSAQSSWSQLAWEVWKRGWVMFIDFLLFVFLWPWPVEFAVGQRHGSPVLWRRKVGFRDEEIYVRRSRDWDQQLGDVVDDAGAGSMLAAHLRQATPSRLHEQKTGYLLMDGRWNLDWAAMVYAHALVDKKVVGMDLFRKLALVHHKHYGWLCYALEAEAEAGGDERARELLAFRNALARIGKEELFYRWVELVQTEATQPGGFSPERQAAAAQKIRELFASEHVDFDELWKQVAGAGVDGAGVAAGLEQRPNPAAD